jgi:hypothetical protein
LGCGYPRRLKEVLIDAGVPREQRDRLPLLCLGDRIVWVPGLTIEQEYRIQHGSMESLRDESTAQRRRLWTARIEPLPRADRESPAGNAGRPGDVDPDSGGVATRGARLRRGAR